MARECPCVPLARPRVKIRAHDTCMSPRAICPDDADQSIKNYQVLYSQVIAHSRLCLVCSCRNAAGWLEDVVSPHNGGVDPHIAEIDIKKIICPASCGKYSNTARSFCGTYVLMVVFGLDTCTH